MANNGTAKAAAPTWGQPGLAQWSMPAQVQP